MYIANLAIANVGYSAHEAFVHGGGRYGSNASLGMRAVDFPRGYRPAEDSVKGRQRSGGRVGRADPSPPTRFAFSSHAPAYNLGNFMRTLALPAGAEPGS